MQAEMQSVFETVKTTFPEMVVTAYIDDVSYEALRHGHDSPLARKLFGSQADLGESILINGTHVRFDETKLDSVRIGDDIFHVDGCSWLGGRGTVLKINIGMLIIR